MLSTIAKSIRAGSASGRAIVDSRLALITMATGTSGGKMPPTPDVTTMLTFAAPMILLYYAGIAASYVIVLRRENRKFPWGTVILILLGLLVVVALIGAFLVVELNYQLVPYWPFLVSPAQ